MITLREQLPFMGTLCLVSMVISLFCFFPAMTKKNTRSPMLAVLWVMIRITIGLLIHENIYGTIGAAIGGILGYLLVLAFVMYRESETVSPTISDNSEVWPKLE